MPETQPGADHSPRARSCGWRLGLDLPPSITISQWADAKRMVAKGTGPEPGRWRTDRAPFQREPMDAVNDLDNEIVVLKWSSQVGKTEILINVSGFFVEQDPAPQLFVMPDLGNAEGFSRTRYQPTIEASPALFDRFGAQKTRDSANTLLEKTFPGGDIVFAGANSPASLASRPRRVVIADEIDKYKSNIGKDGSPIKQAFQRTQNFWNARKIVASTPTIEGLSEIDDWFKKSDQRHYEVPCPHCGEFQPLMWETDEIDASGAAVKVRRVHWPKGEPEQASYICRQCGAAWEEHERHLAVRAGRWRAHAPFNGIAGFYVNALASPWVTLASLAKEWVDSEGDPAKEQAFVNLKLGLAYNATREATTTPVELHARREDYGGEVVPPEVLLVTSFTDVQSDRFETQYLGWGLNDEKWVLDYRVLWADPTDPNSWVRLDLEHLSRAFVHPHGGDMQVEATGIDAGYLQQVVLDFVRAQREVFRPFFAVKGVFGFGRPLWAKSEQRFKAGAQLYLSGVDDGKTTLYKELAIRPTAEVPGSRWRIHFPRHLELGYFEQLVSERVKIDYKAGRPVPSWHLPSGKRNEALDTFVGAMAVRSALSIDYAARRARIEGTQQTVTGASIAALFKR